MRLLFVALALWLLAPIAPAGAGTPGPQARQRLLGLGTCEGGPNDGDACVDAFDCDDEAGAPGTCTTRAADLAVRGILTIVSDKDSGHWDDTSFVPEEKVGKEVVPVDFSRSTLTLILELTHQGKHLAFAETFQDLGDYVNPALDIECRGFCVPTWREPAVEHRIATPSSEGDTGSGGGTGGGGGQAATPGIRIAWGVPPPAMKAALIEALALPEGATPFLEVVNTTEIFDHSRTEDPLGSVRRLKVTIRALLPAAEP